MFIAGVNDTGEKLFSGVNDTGEKFIARQTFIRDYLCEFSKKFETIPVGYSEARGTLVYEKKTEVENLVSESL